MTKVSWERALLKGLKEDGFTGILTMTYRNGVVTATSFDPALPTRTRKARARKANGTTMASIPQIAGQTFEIGE